MAEVPFQSLYRRYRPQRFGEVRGQDHVVRALRNAVRDGRVSHAYLFSGPRGTGKTSTARILAKALNCTQPEDGEPCGTCDSCVAVQAGRSLDLHELDAASNNGVEAVRDLISRTALGTPGRWKVYIIDEVHMLTVGASNALLKTLEEPPGHVVFVLATTDPQKVLPTIKSRTQHFEFRLLAPDVLGGLLHDVAEDAGLAVAPDAIDLVVRRGRGSARDALSVLDQVAASGGVEAEVSVADELIEALCDRDPGRALVAVAEACRTGRDPRRITEDLVERLRDVFLVEMGAAALVDAPDGDRERLTGQAQRLTAAGITRALDAAGAALAQMKESLDPRVALEVAVVRLATPSLDTDVAALVERVARLERQLAGHVTEPDRQDARAGAQGAAGTAGSTGPAARADAPPARPAPAAQDGGGVPSGEASTAAGPAAARATLGALRGSPGQAGAAGRGAPPAGVPPRPAPSRSGPPFPRSPASGSGQTGQPPAAPVSPVASSPAPPGADSTAPPGPAVAAGLPTRDELTKAWGDAVLGALRPPAKPRFAAGRFVAVEGGAAVFGLPNEFHRQRCEEVRADVEHALAAHFGRPVPLRLVVDPSSAPGGAGGFERGSEEAAEDEDPFDPAALGEPAPAVTSPEDVLRQAFPGAEEV